MTPAGGSLLLGLLHTTVWEGALEEADHRQPHPGSQQESTVPRKNTPFLLQSLFEPSLNCLWSPPSGSPRRERHRFDDELQEIAKWQSIICMICFISQNTFLNTAASYLGGIPAGEVSSTARKGKAFCSKSCSKKYRRHPQ